MKKVLAALALVAVSLTLAAPAMATKPDPGHKVSICHRTASDTNPYVFITVDEASLDAHLNNLPGHPAKEWKTDGTFRGVAHVAGDLKVDYEATSADECQDTTPPPPPPPDCEDDGSCPTEPPPTEPPPTTEPPVPPTEPPGDCDGVGCSPPKDTAFTGLDALGWGAIAAVLAVMGAVSLWASKAVRKLKED